MSNLSHSHVLFFSVYALNSCTIFLFWCRFYVYGTDYLLHPPSDMQKNTAILLEERSLVICTAITHISFVRILTAQIKAFANEGLHFGMTDMYFVVIPSCNCFITVMLDWQVCYSNIQAHPTLYKEENILYQMKSIFFKTFLDMKPEGFLKTSWMYIYPVHISVYQIGWDVLFSIAWK